MAIQTIELIEKEVVEIDGEFKEIERDKKRVPCAITNHSLKKGKDMGLLEGSLIADLMKLEKINSKDKAEKMSALEKIDQVEMAKLIYLGCVGINKKFADNYSFDEFLEHLHYDFGELMEIYYKLLQDIMPKDEKNNFAEGLKKSTKKEKKPKAKHQKSK